VQFTDQALAAGVTGVNVSGSAQRYIVEGMMGGAAFFDYDGDGDPDLYIANGSRFEGFPAGQEPLDYLYRNEGGHFAEVAAAAGIRDTAWSMGCAVADYDNDGDLDLYVTKYGPNTLYRNEGGRFSDATGEAGVGDPRWGTGCTFGDYDRDGDVDLYVANYVDFSREYKSTIPCLWKNIPVYCGPLGLKPAPDVLYRNEGDGTFVEVTAQAGMAGEPYFGMAAVFADVDLDGWPDLFVANDSTPNNLFRNLGQGRFEDVGVMAGVAYSGEGVRQGCMGAAVEDYDGDELPDILVTNFADEHNTLYRNDGNGFFSDVSFSSGVGPVGIREVAWGAALFDADNDGDRDLFVANGHTYPQADLPQANSSYAQLNWLFENQGDGRFAEVGQQAGPGLALRRVSRGTSAADYDGDGDVDLLVVNLNDAPTLLRNEGGNAGNYLQVQLAGTRSNRAGIGARLLLSAGNRRQHAQVQSGSSYLSHHDLRVHFGLGRAAAADSLEVVWPSGVRQVLLQVRANQVLWVREPE
jgi:hypothetical protein